MEISKPLVHLSELWPRAILAVIAVTWPFFTFYVNSGLFPPRTACGGRRMGE